MEEGEGRGKRRQMGEEREVLKGKMVWRNAGETDKRRVNSRKIERNRRNEEVKGVQGRKKGKRKRKWGEGREGW